MSVTIKNRTLDTQDTVVAGKLDTITSAMAALGVSTLVTSISDIDAKIDSVVGAKIDALCAAVTAGLTTLATNAVTQTLCTPPTSWADQGTTDMFEGSKYGSVVSFYGKVDTACTVAFTMTVQYSPNASDWYDSDEVISVGAGLTPCFNADIWTAARYVRLRFSIPTGATVAPILEIQVSARA